jgi:hypothetical protein
MSWGIEFAILGKQLPLATLPSRSITISYDKERGKPGTEDLEAACKSKKRPCIGLKLTIDIWRLRKFIDDPKDPAAA